MNFSFKLFILHIVAVDSTSWSFKSRLQLPGRIRANGEKTNVFTGFQEDLSLENTPLKRLPLLETKKTINYAGRGPITVHIQYVLLLNDLL